MKLRDNICTLLSVGATLWASLAFGLSLGFTSPTLSTMTYAVDPDLRVFTNEHIGSLFSAIMAIGCVIGGIIGGFVTNSLGRKTTILICAPILSLSYAMIALGNSNYSFIPILGRFVCGLAIGSTCFIVPLYIAEISPDHLRGTFGTFSQLMITSGVMLCSLINLGIQIEGYKYKKDFVGKENVKLTNWRVLAWIGAVPGILLFFSMWFVPESPHWLAAKGKLIEAKESLSRLRGGAETEKEILELEESANKQHETSGGLRMLVESKKQLCIALSLHVLQHLTGIHFFLSFQQDILESVGVGNDSDKHAFGCMSTQVLVTIVSCFLIDRFGRKCLLVVGNVGMALGCFIIGLTCITPLSKYIVLSGNYLYIASFALGVGAIPWIILGEIFPEKAKSIAASIAAAVNWTTAFAVAMSFKSLSQVITNAGLFWMLSALCICMALFTITWVPETKGKSFSEIQESFDNKGTLSIPVKATAL